jgi:hypothetical protein
MTALANDREGKSSGSLTIVDTGIEAFSHLTLQAKGYITKSDAVFYLVTDQILEHYWRASSRSSALLSGPPGSVSSKRQPGPHSRVTNLAVGKGVSKGPDRFEF